MSRTVHHAPDEAHIFTAYGSNAFRLTLRQWLVVLAIVVPFVALVPKLWRRSEKLEVGADYRMNFKLSNDYWLYSHCAQLATRDADTVVVGDSVIWGPFVTPQQTLAHYLNELAGSARFANLGLNGAHPLALEGLVEHYGTSIAGKRVLLLYNPLWMSSPEQDLQEDNPHINHPSLVPQFSPWIKGYKAVPESSAAAGSLAAFLAEISPRIGIVVERNFEFKQWVVHLQQAYFDQTDIPMWTLSHPYQSPLPQITFAPKPDDGVPTQDPPTAKLRANSVDFEFVALSTSQQWQAFKRTADVLTRRGNRVVVVINALNEHMLTPRSREVYTKLRQQMQDELRARQLECIVPDVLPADEYGDVSHPLSAGYQRLAKELYEKLK